MPAVGLDSRNFTSEYITLKLLHGGIVWTVMQKRNFASVTKETS